jgi:hypothetical protein
MRRTSTIRWFAVAGVVLGLGTAVVRSEPQWNDDGFVVPPIVPRTKPSSSETEELRRLQAELDALKKARSEPPASPAPPADSAAAEAMADRIKLKLKLFDLIEKLQTKRVSSPANPPPFPEAPRLTDDKGKPVDRLRQVQNLYRSGQIQAAQRALQLMDPATFTGRQGAMLKYLRASCHRRAGELDQAKQLYGELASSKDDEFLAECAAWQLQAIKAREELASRLDTTRSPSPNR